MTRAAWAGWPLLSPRRVRFIAAGTGEPTVATADAGLAAAKAAGADVVIGIGGGSAVDTGKAIAALLTQPEGLMAYMEVVGQGKPLVNPSAPFIAVPTTAGTGSEARSSGICRESALRSCVLTRRGARR